MLVGAEAVSSFLWRNRMRTAPIVRLLVSYLHPLCVSPPPSPHQFKNAKFWALFLPVVDFVVTSTSICRKYCCYFCCCCCVQVDTCATCHTGLCPWQLIVATAVAIASVAIPFPLTTVSAISSCLRCPCDMQSCSSQCIRTHTYTYRYEERATVSRGRRVWNGI